MKKYLKILLLAIVSCIACVIFACCNKTYTVVYDVNGGVPLKEGTYTAGESFSLPTPNPGSDPAMYGFKFTGWYYDEACTKKVNRKDVDLSYAKNGTLTFYAGWTDVHTVYFDSMTTEAISSKTYRYREEVRIADLPTPQPYVVGDYTCEFVCWVQANNDKRLTENFKMASEDLYLYALYDTGVNGNYELSEEGYVPQNTSANTTVHDYTLEEGEVFSVDMKFPSVPTNYDGDSGIVFAAENFNESTASFENYIVMFVSSYNNGLGALDFYGTRQFVNEETNETETDFGRLARYTLDSETFYGTEYAKKMAAYKEGDQACTFTYSVRKLGNSWYIGVDGVEYIKLSIGDATVASGKTAAESLTGKLVGLRAKALDVAYDNITVEEAALTLHFDAGKGAVDTASKTCAYDTAVGTLPTPAREGYQFKYWYYEKAGEKVQVTADSKFDNTVWQVFLTAYWEQPSAQYYEVAFDTGIEGYEVDGIAAWTNGNEVEVPILSRAFYAFSGDWYYDEERTQLADLTALDDGKSQNGVITLYADFEKLTNKFNNTAWSESNGVYTGSGTTLVNGLELKNGQTLTVDITLPVYDTVSPYGNSYVYFGAAGLEAVNGYYRMVILGNVDTNVNAHGAIQLYKSSASGSLKSANRASNALISAGYSAAYETYMTDGKTLTFTLGVSVKNNYITCTVNGVIVYTYEGAMYGPYVGFGTTTGFAVSFSNVQITDGVVSGFEGAGTQENPYKINNAADLQRFADEIKAGNTYAGEYLKLTTDIDLGAEAFWTPIAAGFAGVLDGGNYTISNVNIDSQDRIVGFFSELNAGTVKNLRLSVTVKSTADTVGGLVASVSGTVKIENCSVSGNVTGASVVGGLVGYVKAGYLSLTDCVNRANVSATVAAEKNSFVGGILGANANAIKVVLSGCENRGTVQANGHFVGGVAGLIRVGTGSSVTDCFNYGNVQAGETSKYVGGVVGCSRVNMTDCYCLQTATLALGTTGKTASGYASVSTTGTEIGYLAYKEGDVTVTGGLCDANGNAIG